jgi:hypothetical protein
MNKNLLLGIVVAVFVPGMGVMADSESIRFGDVLDTLSGLSPRLLSLVVLPFIVVLVVAGNYLRKKNEERKWKNALLKTRAGRQSQKGSGQELSEG